MEVAGVVVGVREMEVASKMLLSWQDGGGNGGLGRQQRSRSGQQG